MTAATFGRLLERLALFSGLFGATLLLLGFTLALLFQQQLLAQATLFGLLLFLEAPGLFGRLLAASLGLRCRGSGGRLGFLLLLQASSLFGRLLLAPTPLFVALVPIATLAFPVVVVAVVAPPVVTVPVVAASIVAVPVVAPSVVALSIVSTSVVATLFVGPALLFWSG